MNTIIRAIMKSWIPSLAGIGTFLTVLSAQIPLLWDTLPGGGDNTATNPNFNSIVAAFTTMIIGLSTRQSNVSDEEAKAGFIPLANLSPEEQKAQLAREKK